MVTAARDPEGRATIYDTLPEGLPRLMPIGRLDIGSRTLLADQRRCAHAQAGAAGHGSASATMRAFGEVDDRAPRALAQGATIDGMAYGPIEARVDRLQGDNVWLTVPCAKARTARYAACSSMPASRSTA